MKIFRKLKYSTDIQLNATAASIDVHVFSANGLYDPDVTSTGNQPRLFDQYMALYNHYTVVAAAISVETLASQGGACVFGVTALAGSTS